MDLELITRTLRRGWYIVLAALVLGGAGGAWISAAATPEYEAATRLYVSVPGAANSSELAQGGTAAEQKVQSFANVATSALVLGPVIEQLDLGVTSTELAHHVLAQSPIDSVLVDVKVTWDDADTAATIANAIGASLSDVVTTELELPVAGASPFRIETVEPAEPPTSPASPNVAVNVGGGLVLGTLLGFVVAAIRTLLDGRLHSRAEVESAAGAATIGDIPFDKSVREQPLVVQFDPVGPGSEAYRRLRTNLQFLEVGRASRSFVVTSSLPGEGKTTTTVNLALALAENGVRVALVDADLRRSRVAEVMGVEGAVGLTDVLIGRAELDDSLQPWGTGGLVVLPAGVIPPNPAELLASAAMEEIVRELERTFDVVLVDAPPLLPVADAAILAKLTGGALLVASVSRTTRKQLVGARTALTDAGSAPLGTIMTMGRPGRDSGYTYAYRYENRTAAQTTGETPRGAVGA